MIDPEALEDKPLNEVGASDRATCVAIAKAIVQGYRIVGLSIAITYRGDTSSADAFLEEAFANTHAMGILHEREKGNKV